MRGGTSKGVFFRLQDLPERGAGAWPGARCAAAARDRQPRPLRQADRRHGRRDLEHQQDGDPLEERATRPRRRLPVRPGRPSTSPSSTGAATAATCRRRSGRSPSPTVWSIRRACRRTASARVRRQANMEDQANIGKTIVAHVPITDGEVQETGDFELDGVTFPAAEVPLEFMDPAADEGRRRAARCSRPATGRRPGSAGRRHVQGDDDQRRHSDHLRQRRRHRLHRHRAAGRHQRRHGGAGNASRRSAHTARCAWA